MLCPACGAEVLADAAFYPKCGQQMSGAAVQPPDQAAAVAVSPVDRLRPGVHTMPHEGERELWHGSYSPKAMYGGWVFAFPVTIAGIALAVHVPNPAAWIAAAVAVPLIWLAVLLTLVYRRLAVDYTFTT